MDFFEHIEEAPADPIFGLGAAFRKDSRQSKVNLGIGAYCTADLKPHIMTSVKEAERKLLESESSKNYLPIEGDPKYLELAKELMFGAVASRPIASVQSVGGTGALRLGADFLVQSGIKEIYLPDPTWGNHKRIFATAGLKVHTYPYYNPEIHGVDFEAMMEAVGQMPPTSAILLHGCCHNPTGFDPTEAQFAELLTKLTERGVLPFFDIAYQGFGDGIEQDAGAIRKFVEAGTQILVACSFSKNFGLYAERTGVLFAACTSKQQQEAVLSQLKVLVRGNYSNPACHGARIVANILGNPALKTKWQHELETMRGRIGAMRQALVSELSLRSKGSAEPFAYIGRSKGMFAFTGLSGELADRLIFDYGIYLLKNGRINLAGLNTENISYVADGIMTVYESVS